jgi:flavin reductase (DIM6/NTAB) family NADH-FMN oxidoreductase RutF
MDYDPVANNHGLRYSPFKALLAPRPIGWISSLGADGSRNLAPYSFFNCVSETPPMVMFSSYGRKDSLANIEQTGEFTCSLATWDLREQMNMSSAPVARGVDEFALAGLTPAPSRLVKPPRVAQSPAAFECKVWKLLELPKGRGEGYTVVFGSVVSVYLDEAFVHDGLVDTGAMRPIARMGYMQYSVVTPETVFAINRPDVAADGRTATVQRGTWDGKYR